MRTVKVDNGNPICLLQETKSDFFVTGALSNRGFVSCFPHLNSVILIYAAPGSSLPRMTLFIVEANGCEEYGQVPGFWRFLGIPAIGVKSRGIISREVFGGMASG